MDVIKLGASQIFFAAFFMLQITGVISPFEYNLLPALPLLEVLFLAVTVLTIRKIDVGGALFLVTASGYLLFSLFLATYFKNANIFDFMQAYKAFFYVAVLSFYVGKDIFSLSWMRRIFLCSLFLFGVKYSYSLALDLTPRLGERPGIFDENNFELVFLIILFYFVKDSFRKPLFVYLILFIVVFMSGSRSALLGALFVYLFSFVRKLDFHFFITVLAFPLLVALVAMIFTERMDGGIESIDRFRFMMVFVDEVKDWPVSKFLFGSFPITPLSNEACYTLKDYSALYSYSGDGSCYSVILHSYFFRVIYDHGILGFAFILWFVFYAMTKKGYSKRDVLCVYSVLFSSALSVSSFNSIFSALVLSIVFSAKNGSFEEMRKTTQV